MPAGEEGVPETTASADEVAGSTSEDETPA
jgi:hypothetical protein